MVLSFYIVASRTTQPTWDVYVIRTSSGTLYTGITTDLNRRLREHVEGKKGARFFRISEPSEVVFRKRWDTRSEAARRESAIKQMLRPEKLRLIMEGRS